MIIIAKIPGCLKCTFICTLIDKMVAKPGNRRRVILEAAPRIICGVSEDRLFPLFSPGGLATGRYGKAGLYAECSIICDKYHSVRYHFG